MVNWDSKASYWPVVMAALLTLLLTCSGADAVRRVAEPAEVVTCKLEAGIRGCEFREYDWDTATCVLVCDGVEVVY